MGRIPAKESLSFDVGVPDIITERAYVLEGEGDSCL